MDINKMKRPARVVLLMIFVGFLCVFFYSQTVDRIVAVVNEEVITLTDIQIAEAFGLWEDEMGGDTENLRQRILEKMIEQKVVIQLSGEDISLTTEEMDEFLMRITQRLGADGMEDRLMFFGLEQEDLKDCIREKISYQTILEKRFSKVNPVSLRDIEDYYHESYVPAQKDKGIEPQPMMDILDELESAIKQDKMKAQIEDWIRKLKEKSDIQIIKGRLRSP
jgi:parvulin-like peptidyl-prolyl isomerase